MAELDAALLWIGALLALAMLLLGLFIGRMLDPYYRIRQMRRFLKRDYLILKKVGKDAKTIIARIINAESTAFLHRGGVWVVEKGRIYRDLGFEKGGNVRIKEGGFDFRPGMSEVKISYEEGVPVIYVDDEHIKPLNFNNEEALTSPSGAGGAIVAWVLNQIAKGAGDMQKYTIFFILLGLLATASLYFAWQANGQIGDIKTKLDNVVVVTAQNNTAQNNTLVITASGVSTIAEGSL